MVPSLPETVRGQDSGPRSLPMSLGFFICKTELYYLRHRATHGRMGETLRQACLGPAPGQVEASGPAVPPSPQPGRPALCWGLRCKPWRAPCAQLCQQVALAFAILHSYPGARAAQALHQSPEHREPPLEAPGTASSEGQGYLGKRNRPQSRARWLKPFGG